jgi:hypothetical protein
MTNIKQIQKIELMMLLNTDDEDDINPPRLSQHDVDQIFEQMELELHETGRFDWEGSDFGFYDCEVPPVMSCNHAWRPTQLLTSTVYDCKHCGIKKEDVDNKY